MREEFTMKTRGPTRRILAWLLVLTMCLSLLPGMALAEETSKTIAEWSFTAAPESGRLPAAATGGVNTSAQVSVSGANYTGYSTKSLCANNWTENGYWLISGLDTSGYTGLKLSAKMRSSKTGPANFQLEYSTDGSTWAAVDNGSVTITSTSLAEMFNGLSLPEAAISKSLSLRIRMTDTTSVNGGTVATDGASNINNIVITGTSAGEEGPEEPQQVAAPTASPVSGTSVKAGDTVTLACATEGVTYQVSATGTDAWTDLTGNIFTIPSDAAGTYTIYVKAVKSGMSDSNVLTLTYTVESEPDPAPAGSAEKVTALSTLDKIIIYNPGSGMAISGTASGKKLAGAAGTVADDKLTVAEEMQEFVVSVDTDGYYSFITADGKYLTGGATGNSLSLADAASEYSLWTLAADGDGYVINNVNAQYNSTTQAIEYYSGFTTYGTKTGNAAYIMQFYKTGVASELPGGSGGEEPEPDTITGTLTESLAHGDQVVIYYPAGDLAMTATASGAKLTGVSGTVAANTMTTDTSAAVFTVYKDIDGNVSFVTADGKYLTSGKTGNSLSLADAAGDYSLWTLETAEGGFYIKSVNAAYNGNGQYIEYYSGFTTYGFNAGKTGIYTFRFYKTGHVNLPAPTVDYKTDSSVVESIASWGGMTKPENTETVNGDKYASSDELDTTAVYSAVGGGATVNPWVQGGTAPNYLYYMGGANVGKAEGDYAQFAVSTAGWGDMTLSFRLRATKTAPGSFQLQYSTDGGESFENFTTGSYSYSYTQYTSDGSYPVTGEGKITDGVAKTSLAPTYYITFTFDVPSGAENAKNLLIRLAPGSERADGKTGTVSGNIRIDSVVLAGSPIVHDGITGYVSVDPDGREEDQAAGTALTMSSATEGAVISYRFVDTATGKGDWQTYDASDKPVLPDTLPATLEVRAASTGRADSVTRVFTYAAGTVQAVKMSPNGGGVYIKEGESAEVTLSCATEGAVIYYSTNGGETYQTYTAPITLEKGFGSLTVQAYAAKDGFKTSVLNTRTFVERSTDTYSLYFGQLHSHTSYSDGAGSCEDAFQHASGLDESYNLDFLAVTDHSNSFDNADSASLADGSVSSEWVEGHELAYKYTTDDFVGIYGFEMTWSNGLGHINTYNTPGFQSRTQTEFSTYSTALQNYYAVLKTDSDSLSQFNHPGTTFGDFSDFSYYDEEIDNLITLIEVGNGEGAIGSSGYFPSYEYYTRALDKGWHLAPSNNQDNHKGMWGDANTARTVVLADSLTQDAIYDAIRNYRVYATEDLNLEINYTLDGNVMGTILDGASGDTAKIVVGLSDIDDAGSATVEVIVNGGLSLAKATATCNETVEFEVPATYSYYYIKVTQADGDIAVTAPVWLGEVEAVGISSLTAGSELTVAGEEQTFTLNLYNNEKTALNISSVVFTDKATGKVLHTDGTVSSVGKLSTASCSFGYTFPTDGIITITATVKGTLNGVEKIYTQDLELTVMPASVVSKVIVDGTHYNDYVTGYYGGNMSNMTTIAADNGVKVEVVRTEITAAMLEDCSLLVISAPARKNGTANAGAYTASVFEDSFIELVADYVKGGGNVIVCGLADYQDKSAVNGADGHAAAQINKLLEAIGSTMRINDDEVYDPVKNGGQFYRLYPENFNMESQWTAGVVDGQTYSQYSGCSVDPGKGTWLVRGFDTTYSVDSDKDGVGATGEIETDDTYGYNIVTPRGEVVFLACEDTAYGGTVFAAGGVFLSDFEVKAELDNIWDLPYANRTIYENILGTLCATENVTPIAKVRKAELNRVFVVEGYVTNGTANPNTTFFDAIYIQDETGGTTVFPYATESLEIGTKVRVIGYTDAYQGDREMQVISLKVLNDEPNVYEPKELSTQDAMDYGTYGGQLVSTQGKVSDIIKSNGIVSQFKLTDATGVAATVFIDGYITNEKGLNTIGTWIRDGQTVSAVGLLYLHPEGSSDVSVPVLRVRNCDEIKLVSGGSSSGSDSSSGSVTYPVTVGGSEHGAVTLTPKAAGTGATVTITVRPDDGYELDELTVTDKNGSALKLTSKSNGKYTFVMPASKVTVNAVFIKTVKELPFTDIPDGAWYEDAARFVYENGLMNGTSATTFGPNGTTTRAMIVAILYRLENEPGAGDSGFQDVPNGQYYTGAVAWASANGIVNGYGDGTFGPNNTITREQLAAILYRYAAYKGYDVTARADLSGYTDVGSVGGYAVEAMQWANAEGLVNGTSATTLTPKGSATRAQVAAILTRFCENVAK